MSIPTAVRVDRMSTEEDRSHLTRELRTFVIKPPAWAWYEPGTGFRYEVTSVKLTFGRNVLPPVVEEGTETPRWVLAEVYLSCPDPLDRHRSRRDVWLPPNEESPNASPLPWPEWLHGLVDAYSEAVASRRA